MAVICMYSPHPRTSALARHPSAARLHYLRELGQPSRGIAWETGPCKIGHGSHKQGVKLFFALIHLERDAVVQASCLSTTITLMRSALQSPLWPPHLP